MSKQRRKGNAPAPTTLSVYTVRLPPSNHCSRSDVPSESHPMILHTTSKTLYQYNHTISSNVATPQSTSLLYLIIRPPSCRSLHVSQHLRLSVTQFLQHPHYTSTFYPKYLRIFLRCDSIPLSGSRSSGNNLQWSWLLWVLLMELFHHL
jgi:hypothetical protein